MHMDLKENKRKCNQKKMDKNHNFIESLGYALEGLNFAFKNERNIRFQMAATFLVGIAGFVLQLNAMEWVVIILACTLVLVTEMTNTIAEWLVDLVTEYHYHPVAKKIKDVAAGAVLLASLFSIIVGIIVFLPKIVVLIEAIK